MYMTPQQIRVISQSLFDRAQAIQSDPRELAKQNARQLYQLASFFWQSQDHGSLRLPAHLHLDAQVEAIELVRDALLSECERYRGAGKDDLADRLHAGINSLLEANPVSSSFVVSEEELFDVHSTLVERTLHEDEREWDFDDMRVAALA
jgi:hypothetical protein